MVEERRADPVRVHQRRVRVRRDVGRHRGRRRPAPAPTPRPPARACCSWSEARLQRLRTRAADRHDRRQPGHRRADQHLERPQRRDVAARLRLDPAVRRDQPGGARPAHPGLPPGRGALAAGDGLHGRLHPDARLSSGVEIPEQAGGRRLPAAVRPRQVLDPDEPVSHRRDGRARGVHRGPLPGASPRSCEALDADPGDRRRVPATPSAATRAAWCTATACEDAETIVRRARFGARHDQGRRRRAARRRGCGSVSSGITSFRPFPAAAVREALDGAHA